MYSNLKRCYMKTYNELRGEFYFLLLKNLSSSQMTNLNWKFLWLQANMD
jgi:hypothetical protein